MNSSDPSTRGAGFLFLSHPTKHNFVDHNRQGQRSWIIADICDQCLTGNQDCSVNTRHNLSLKLYTDCISAIYTRCKSVTCDLAHFVWSCSKLYTKGKNIYFIIFQKLLGGGGNSTHSELFLEPLVPFLMQISFLWNVDWKKLILRVWEMEAGACIICSCDKTEILRGRQRRYVC